MLHLRIGDDLLLQSGSVVVVRVTVDRGGLGQIVTAFVTGVKRPLVPSS